jgi:hypothetical protein
MSDGAEHDQDRATGVEDERAPSPVEEEEEAATAEPLSGREAAEQLSMNPVHRSGGSRGTVQSNALNERVKRSLTVFRGGSPTPRGRGRRATIASERKGLLRGTPEQADMANRAAALGAADEGEAPVSGVVDEGFPSIDSCLVAARLAGPTARDMMLVAIALARDLSERARGLPPLLQRAVSLDGSLFESIHADDDSGVISGLGKRGILRQRLRELRTIGVNACEIVGIPLPRSSSAVTSGTATPTRARSRLASAVATILASQPGSPSAQDVSSVQDWAKAVTSPGSGSVVSAVMSEEGGDELAARQAELEEWQARIEGREREVESGRAELAMAMTEKLRLRELLKVVEQREGAVAAKEAECSDAEQRARLRKEELQTREESVSSRESRVATREADVTGREEEVETREARVAAREAGVIGREEEVETREDAVRRAEAALRAEEEACAVGRHALDSEQQTLAERQRELSDGVSRVEAREADVSRREAFVSERESAGALARETLARERSEVDSLRAALDREMSEFRVRQQDFEVSASSFEQELQRVRAGAAAAAKDEFDRALERVRQVEAELHTQLQLAQERHQELDRRESSLAVKEEVVTQMQARARVAAERQIAVIAEAERVAAQRIAAAHEFRPPSMTASPSMAPRARLDAAIDRMVRHLDPSLLMTPPPAEATPPPASEPEVAIPEPVRAQTDPVGEWIERPRRRKKVHRTTES